MRYALLLTILLTSSVYAEQRPGTPRSLDVTAGHSAALAFGPVASIDRDERQMSAFVGYDTGVVTTFSLCFDDFQSNFGSPFFNCGFGFGCFGANNGFLERRAITQTTGVRFR